MAKNFIVLSESRLDFKYKSIWRHLPQVEIAEGGLFRLLRLAILYRFDNSKVIYHIRYLKSGRLGYIRYFILALFQFFGFFHIVWTCHNIEEHNFKNEFRNRILRRWLSINANCIVVFHQDLIAHLPEVVRDKSFVASFGDMREYVESQTKSNTDFKEKYDAWMHQNKYPALLSISAAKKSNLKLAIEGLKTSKMTGIFIAPNVSRPAQISDENILFYNGDFVRKEVIDLLNIENIIGYVGHGNISVPTSLYMFASFGVPVIGLNIEPVNSIIEKYNIGRIVSTPEELNSAISLIRERYTDYSENCRKMIEDNSWEKSAKIHNELLGNL